MTVAYFLILFTAFSTITSLMSQGVKDFLKSIGVKYASNVVVLVVALVVGIFGTLIYYQLAGVPGSVNNMICAVLMGIANWLGAMVGYDKVKQAIGQLVQ